jgi:hypothetical protein
LAGRAGTTGEVFPSPDFVLVVIIFRCRFRAARRLDVGVHERDVRLRLVKLSHRNLSLSIIFLKRGASHFLFCFSSPNFGGKSQEPLLLCGGRFCDVDLAIRSNK